MRPQCETNHDVWSAARIETFLNTLFADRPSFPPVIATSSTDPTARFPFRCGATLSVQCRWQPTLTARRHRYASRLVEIIVLYHNGSGSFVPACDPWNGERQFSYVADSAVALVK